MREGEPPDLTLALSLRAGDRFDVLHLERVRLDDREVFTRRTRFALEIRERTPQGSYLVQGTIARERPDDPSISVSTRLRFEWLPDGRIRAYPRAQCVGEDGELELARFVRFTLGSSPLGAAGGHASVEAWHGELPLDAEVHTSALDAGRVRIDVVVEDRLANADLGALRVDGAVRVRSRFELDRDTGLVGFARREARGDVWFADARSGQEGFAPLAATFDTSIERRDRREAKEAGPDTEVEADPCAAGSRPIMDVMVRAITQRRARIQLCYEQGLRADPTLSGRLEMRVRVVSPGHMAMAEPASSAFDGTLTGCVRDAVAQLDASPGPIAGGISFTFPFVFERQSGTDPAANLNSP